MQTDEEAQRAKAAGAAEAGGKNVLNQVCIENTVPNFNIHIGRY